MLENENAINGITLQMIDDSFNMVKKGEIVKGTIVSVSANEVLVDIGYKSEGTISTNEFSSLPEVNSSINVYVVSIENNVGKVILSKKIADLQQNFLFLVEKFEKNEKVEGEVKKLVNGGFFVDIAGCNSFLPGSLVDVKPIKNYESLLGQTLELKIISIDKAKRNIIVSRKKCLLDENQKKRSTLLNKIKVEAELDGEVKSITNYGAFIDLGGLDGLLHISDMSWGEIKHPSDMLKVGDRLKVKIIAYDQETQRISLGIKQLVPNPWENIEKKYSQGDKATGTVVNITNYGAFVEIESGVKGLIHKSEISWTKKIYHPKQVLNVGDKINAIILSLSKQEKKISLGLKQMTLNPWLNIEDKYEIGQTIKRKINSITSFGLFLELDSGIDGLVHITDVSWTKRIEDLRKIYSVGQEIEVVILDIDKSLHKVSFGIKQLAEDPWETLQEIVPIGSILTGEITRVVNKKGLVVKLIKDSMEFEGFVPISFLDIDNMKELTSDYKENEMIELEVYEIDKQNHRIVLKLCNKE